MSCELYGSEAVHLALGQGDQPLLDAFLRHRGECPDCDQEALLIESLRGLLQAAAEQPASDLFRERLRNRLLEEQRLEDAQLLEESSFPDRVISRLAYARFRVVGSSVLRVLLAAAALYLVAFSIYLAWNSGDERSAQQERPLAGEPADPHEPQPVRFNESTSDDLGDTLVALERLDPPRPRDVIIEAPPFPLAQPRLPEEPFSIETVREVQELTLRENLFVQARFRMRHRFSWSAGRPEAKSTSGSNDSKDPKDRAVVLSLRYLSEVQERNGSWDPEAFGGQPEARVGTTALCLLAFLVNADRGIPGGLYRQHVERALDYLRSSVTQDHTIGAVRGDEDVVLFNQALSTLAFAEHYLLRPGSDLTLLMGALDRLEELGARQRFRERQEADNITAPWVALALETGRAAGVPARVNLAQAAADAQSFVAKLVDLDPQSGAAMLPSEQLCAMACASALDPLFDDIRDHDRYQPPIDLLLRHLREPSLREPTKIFFAALDALSRGGDEWQRFDAAAVDVLLNSQNADGSWSQEYEWDRVGSMGGDLYETALAVMVLSASERIAR